LLNPAVASPSCLFNRFCRATTYHGRLIAAAFFRQQESQILRSMLLATRETAEVSPGVSGGRKWLNDHGQSDGVPRCPCAPQCLTAHRTRRVDASLSAVSGARFGSFIQTSAPH
jgi:hypothetical protein